MKDESTPIPKPDPQFNDAECQAQFWTASEALSQRFGKGKVDELHTMRNKFLVLYGQYLMQRSEVANKQTIINARDEEIARLKKTINALQRGR